MYNMNHLQLNIIPAGVVISMFNSERFRFVDKIQICEVNDDGSMGKVVLETCSHPSILDRFLKYIGLKNYANDLIMDVGIQDVATMLKDRYNYIQNGESDADMATSTLTDLKSPLATARVSATKGLETTYLLNDTAIFTGVFTNNTGSTQTVLESGLFKDATTSVDDIMFCRQTFSYTALNGSTYGVIWKITVTRG